MIAFLIAPTFGYMDGNAEYLAQTAHAFRRKGVKPVLSLDDDPGDQFRILLQCRNVILLPGWEKDAQARLLAGVASQIGCKLYDESLRPVKVSVVTSISDAI